MNLDEIERVYQILSGDPVALVPQKINEVWQELPDTCSTYDAAQLLCQQLAVIAAGVIEQVAAMADPPLTFDAALQLAHDIDVQVDLMQHLEDDDSGPAT